MRGLGHPLLLFRTSTSLSSLLNPPKPSLLPSPAPTLPFSTSSPFSSSPRPLKESARLTPEELAEINLLIPRLCESNRLPEAVRLIDTCLLTNPSLQSLPLSVLIARLCSGPDMVHSMSLLTALKHNPRCDPRSLTTICSMLITSYFKDHRPKEAMKVFSWMGRPNSPCPADLEVNRIVIGGLCRHGMTLEALRVLSEIVGSEVVPATEVREWVYRSLLREARIREAQELDKALGSMGEGGNEAREGVIEVLDRMIAVWKE